MRATNDPRRQHLKNRNGQWYLNVPIPSDLRHLYLTANGKPKDHVIQALGTGDLREAFQLKLPLLTALLAEFAMKRQELTGAGPAALLTAVRLRDDLRRAKAWDRANPRDEDSDEPTQSDIVELVAFDLADAMDRQPPGLNGRPRAASKKAKTFYKIVTGAETLSEAFEAWIAKSVYPPRTVSKHRTALNEFLAFLGEEHHLIPAMNKENALAYVEWLDREGRDQRSKRLVPLAFNTKVDRIMSLHAFWDQGISKRLKTDVQLNPWAGLKPTDRPVASDIPWDSKGRTGAPVRRHPLTDSDILAILDAKGPRPGGALVYTKRTIIEVFTLALLTGARPDEFCSRLLQDIQRDDDCGGYWMRISNAKNAESNRRIPIVHPIAVGILKRRIGDRTDRAAQLFEEFRPKAKQNSLYDLVGRALSRHLGRAINLDSGAVAYCARHTFMTRLGAREDVNNSFLQRYVGHAASSMMDKHYREISPGNLLDIAKKVQFEYSQKIASRMTEELELDTLA